MEEGTPAGRVSQLRAEWGAGWLWVWAAPGCQLLPAALFLPLAPWSPPLLWLPAAPFSRGKWALVQDLRARRSRGAGLWPPCLLLPAPHTQPPRPAPPTPLRTPLCSSAQPRTLPWTLQAPRGPGRGGPGPETATGVRQVVPGLGLGFGEDRQGRVRRLYSTKASALLLLLLPWVFEAARRSAKPSRAGPGSWRSAGLLSPTPAWLGGSKVSCPAALAWTSQETGTVSQSPELGLRLQKTTPTGRRGLTQPPLLSRAWLPDGVQGLAP